MAVNTYAMADLVQQVNTSLATACKNTTDIAVDYAYTSNGLNISEYMANFTLNQTKAIDKKLASCDRNNPLTVNHTSGGTVLKFKTGMYKLFRMCTGAFSNNRREAESSINLHPDRDDAGNVYRENYKISINSCYQYTINLFHTTCTVFVNRQKVIEHFLQRDLPLIASYTSEKDGDEININLNTRIQEALLGTKPKTRRLGFDTDLLQQPHNCETLEGSSPKRLLMLKQTDQATKQSNQQEKPVVSLVGQDNDTFFKHHPDDAASPHHESAHSGSSEAVDVHVEANAQFTI